MTNGIDKARNGRFGVADVLLLATSAGFLAGILLVFGPCGPADDGSWMSCHWAGNAIAALAAVLVAIAIAHACAKDPGMKVGLAVGAIPVAVAAAVLPGNVIALCMMESMRCHAIMRPATIACAAAVAASAVASIVVNRRRMG